MDPKIVAEFDLQNGVQRALRPGPDLSSTERMQKLRPKMEFKCKIKFLISS